MASEQGNIKNWRLDNFAQAKSRAPLKPNKAKTHIIDNKMLLII
jgi:hypothetical protein